MPPRNFAGGEAAVVVDVLRATSVITTSLASGADRVITVADIESAKARAEHERCEGRNVLLCGERKCQRIEGFDRGNSPSEYENDESVDTIVLTTSNGTVAMESVAAADALYAASVLNAEAVVAALEWHRDVHLIASGTEGFATAEDILLCGVLARALIQANDRPWFCDDGTEIAMQSCPLDLAPVRHDDWWRDRLRRSLGGRNLIQRGHEADIDRCGRWSVHAVLPTRIGNRPLTFAADGSGRSGMIGGTPSV